MVKGTFLGYLLCLLATCAAPLATKPWGPVPPAFQPLVEEAARNAIDEMGVRQLFNEAAIFSRVVSSSYLRAEPGGSPHYFIIMDVDRGGETALVSVETYKEGGEWKLVLPVPGKNRKETAPETLTSLTDDWMEIPTSHSLVLEAAPEAERLLVTFIFQAAASPPSLVRVLHAETRTRDMAVEMTYLVESEAASKQEAEDASAAILSLQQTLVEKLSTKEAALEEAELQNSDPSAIISALDSEIAALNAQLSTQQTKQERSQAAQAQAAEALKLLQLQVTASQNEVAAGAATVPGARSYLLLLAMFKEGGVSAVTFKRLILMYKDSSGTWKLTHQEPFAV